MDVVASKQRNLFSQVHAYVALKALVDRDSKLPMPFTKEIINFWHAQALKSAQLISMLYIPIMNCCTIFDFAYGI